MAKKNSSILWTVYQSGGDNTADVIGNQGRIKAQDNIGLGDGFIKAAVSKNYVTNVSRDSNSGKLLVNVAQPSLSDLQGMGSTSANKAIVTAGDNDTAQNGTLIAKTLTATNNPSNLTTNVFVSDITEDGQGNITFTTKTLSTATTSAIGGVKSTTTGTTAGRDYYVQVESNGQMKVNVPWENNTHYDSKTVICKTNNGTANTAVTSSETVYLNHVENNGVVSSHKILGTNCNITSDSSGHLTIAPVVPLATTSVLGGVKSTTTGTTSGRDYYVQVESDGKMKVNVPWENNTHYSSKTVICKTNNGTSDTAVTSSETVYLNHVENGAVQSSHKILGTNCNITADSSGHLTIAPVITAPGNAKLKFQFGSANAVETGFTANASSDTTYTFPTAATSAYGVTKLMTYGSSTPSSWSTFQTTDDSAVTSKYVYNYAASNFFSRHEVSNPTWNTALNTEGFWKVTNSSSTDSPGTGTWFTLTGDASTYKAQLAFGDSVQYRTYSSSSWSRWNTLSAITYMHSGGGAAAVEPVYQMYVNPNTGKVMAYTDVAITNSTDLGYLVPTTDIGSVINPVYVDNGEVKACYPLTPAYSAAAGGISSILLSSDDTEHKYFIDAKNYSRYYKYHATVPASGNDPEVPDHFTYPQVGGFLFGDGFGSVELRSAGSGAPTNYWGVGGSGSTAAEAMPSYYNNPPAVIEAPSVLYAMTTLIPNSYSGCDKELWNKHRIYEYDTCSMCRNVVRHSPALAATSYIATKTLDNDHPALYTAIAFIPPLHWAFVSGVIDVDYSHVTGTFSETRVRFQFDLKSTETDTNGIGDDTVHALDLTLVPDRLSGSDVSNFSFFAYNPDNSHGRYLNCTCSFRQQGLVYTIRKQIMIVKTPENGSFDYVYDNYPPGWKSSQT